MIFEIKNDLKYEADIFMKYEQFLKNFQQNKKKL